MIFQDSRSPIENRQWLRIGSAASVALTILVCATPYIQGFMFNKQEAETQAQRQKENDRSFDEKVKKADAEVKHTQIEARKNAAIAKIRIDNGCTFVDPPIASNAPITVTVTVKGRQVERPMADGSIICDRLNNTAVVKDGIATDLKSLGTNKSLEERK